MADLSTVQDIARSGFADMVNDDERNRAYDSAIQISVAYLIRNYGNGGKFFNCCDIGTGSGLLSMMVARAFREQNYHNFHVHAFEAFAPMAACAKRVIIANNMSDSITVIPKRSDEVEPDEVPKVDLLVAELLDTELIGESCLSIYKHAVQNLCSYNCIFVPHKATIFVEPVGSNFLHHRNSLEDIRCDLGVDREAVIKVNPECEIRPDHEDLAQRATRLKGCPGKPNIDDIQASALKEGEDFHRFSTPIPVFTFWFNNIDSMKDRDQVEVVFPIKKTPVEKIVLVMWWDLYMYDQQIMSQLDEQPSIDLHTISCAPTWARSDEMLVRDARLKDFYGREVWRDHWIQGVYHLPYTRNVTRKLEQSPRELKIFATRDDFSMWFDVDSNSSRYPPSCSKCIAQRTYSKAQLSFFSDKSMLPKLVAAALYYHEKYPITGQLIFQSMSEEEMIDQNLHPCLESMWRISWYERCNIPPINDLHYCDWMNKAGVLSRFLEGQCIELIDHFKIKFTQVHFSNLNRICTRVGNCEGFNLKELDLLIHEASTQADLQAEPHYLWEYGCKRFDRDHLIYSSEADGTDCRQKIIDGTFWKHFELNILGHDEKWRKGWALVFWIEYTLKNTGDIISTGPIGGRNLYEDIEWNRSCQQHVHFLHDFPIYKLDIKSIAELDVGIKCLNPFYDQRFALQVQWPFSYR